ncbi:MAG: CotH kinase family protein [Myxococcota bacterium]|jgi:hypothetical protein|nr:CotH kinase family protein [Myxococcota bacterium]
MHRLGLPLALLATASWLLACDDAPEQVDAAEQSPEYVSLRINEIVAKPGSGNDWVELYNAGSSSVSLDRCHLVDSDPEHQPQQLPPVLLEPGAFFVIEAVGSDATPEQLPFKLGATDNLTLSLDGKLHDQLAWNDGDAPDLAAFGRLPDGADNTQTLQPTRSSRNRAWQDPPSLFDQTKVSKVELELYDDGLAQILAEPLAETYHHGAIIYDGYRLDDVQIRVKGNSSLRTVVQMGSTRFSFKVDLNRTLPEQTLNGLKKLNFNNQFRDPSLMREFLAYRIAESLGLIVPRRSYVELWVNGELYGLYLAVEDLDKSFLAQHFVDNDGQLYKPEPPAGKLSWMGSDYAAYEASIGFESRDDEHSALLTLLSALDAADLALLERSLDIDAALGYLAFNTLLVNLDSYLGPGHNYYLYEQDGRFTILLWDLNEAFGNFTCNCQRQQLIDLLIDEPTCAPLSELPLLDVLLAQPAYLERYHALLEAAAQTYLDETLLESWISEVFALISPYVREDPKLLFSFEAFERSIVEDVRDPHQTIIGLLPFARERSLSIQEQLDGMRPRTADGKGSCKLGWSTKPCGDGVCDERERANPALCPADCGP